MDKQYLLNRYDRLKSDLDGIIAEYKQRPAAEHSLRFLSRLRGTLRGNDHLPLLEQTFEQMTKAFKTPEKLKNAFEKAARSKSPVSFAFVSSLVNGASEAEKQAIVNDEELMSAAMRCLAPPSEWVPQNRPLPNDFPEFVRALGAHQHGKVTPLDEAVVDTALRKTLVAWVQTPVDSGITVEGHVVVLKTAYLKKVQEKYSAKLPGGGNVNAFTEEGTIYLDANQGDETTIIHEAIHLYAQGAFRTVFGDGFDEGVTEYFARLVAASLEKHRQSYQEEFAAADAIIGAIPAAAVARAYFEGNDDQMKAKFLALRQGFGIAEEAQRTVEWATFKDHLQNKRWDDAKRLVVAA